MIRSTLASAAATAAAAATALMPVVTPTSPSAAPGEAALGVAPPAAPSPAQAAAARPSVDGSIPVATNPRWTGYIATPASDGVASFDRVQASYTVPTADCAATPNTFAYQWVGLDGYSDSTIEQDGVGVICSGTTPDYFSWYEMYPSGLQEQFAVTPGDTITSSVVYSPATQDYTLALTDTTSDQSFSLAEACPSGSTCDNSSAETNSEGYYSDGTFTGTTDFGTETFSDIRLGGTTAAGKQKTGALKNSGWGLLKAQALGQSGKADAKAGAITQAGTPSRSSFTVTWLRAN